jgi:hypothetical protein
MPFLIAAKLLLDGWLKAALSAVSSFFRALNAQGWIGLIASATLAFLLVRAESESRHWHKQSDRYEKLYAADHATLQRISSTRNEQAQRTGENLKVVTKVIHDADERARVVERAPPAPGCKTNQAVMGADL